MLALHEQSELGAEGGHSSFLPAPPEFSPLPAHAHSHAYVQRGRDERSARAYEAETDEIISKLSHKASIAAAYENAHSRLVNLQADAARLLAERTRAADASSKQLAERHRDWLAASQRRNLDLTSARLLKPQAPPPVAQPTFFPTSRHPTGRLRPHSAAPSSSRNDRPFSAGFTGPSDPPSGVLISRPQFIRKAPTANRALDATPLSAVDQLAQLHAAAAAEVEASAAPPEEEKGQLDQRAEVAALQRLPSVVSSVSNTAPVSAPPPPLPAHYGGSSQPGPGDGAGGAADGGAEYTCGGAGGATSVAQCAAPIATPGLFDVDGEDGALPQAPQRPLPSEFLPMGPLPPPIQGVVLRLANEVVPLVSPTDPSSKDLTVGRCVDVNVTEVTVRTARTMVACEAAQRQRLRALEQRGWRVIELACWASNVDADATFAESAAQALSRVRGGGAVAGPTPSRLSGITVGGLGGVRPGVMEGSAHATHLLPSSVVGGLRGGAHPTWLERARASDQGWLPVVSSGRIRPATAAPSTGDRGGGDGLLARPPSATPPASALSSQLSPSYLRDGQTSSIHPIGPSVYIPKSSTGMPVLDSRPTASPSETYSAAPAAPPDGRAGDAFRVELEGNVSQQLARLESQLQQQQAASHADVSRAEAEVRALRAKADADAEERNALNSRMAALQTTMESMVALMTSQLASAAVSEDMRHAQAEAAAATALRDSTRAAALRSEMERLGVDGDATGGNHLTSVALLSQLQVQQQVYQLMQQLPPHAQRTWLAQGPASAPSPPLQGGGDHPYAEGNGTSHQLPSAEDSAIRDNLAHPSANSGVASTNLQHHHSTISALPPTSSLPQQAPPPARESQLAAAAGECDASTTAHPRQSTGALPPVPEGEGVVAAARESAGGPTVSQPGSRPMSAAATGSRPMSAVAAPGSRPVSAGATGSRPMSAAAAAGSRPMSATAIPGSRPMSAGLAGGVGADPRLSSQQAPNGGAVGSAGAGRPK